jgi:hypothetical protein
MQAACLYRRFYAPIGCFYLQNGKDFAVLTSKQRQQGGEVAENKTD